ncbi:MAG: hypothetical protein JWR16_1721 [Nevskia sp.]|nr:hypothetical protein [Nevskia sp.]
MNAPELQVQSGAVVALRLFDIAYSIDLSAAEKLWSARSSMASSRTQLVATPAKAVAFDVPPVLLTLDAVALTVDGRDITAGVTARLYDFGVVALALKVPVSQCSWSDFTKLFNALDQAVGPGAQTELWETLLAGIHASMAAALVRPTLSGLQEDYLLAVVQQWSEPIKAMALQERIDLAPLLSGERRTLSEGARSDLLRQRFSYYEDDLVVLTWDRAFIYEPRSDSDVADVLEVANAQLLELRYYDELLDDELPRMYDLVEETRRSLHLLAPRRFADLARKLYTLVAEVTELTERVDNALQVTEDVYLARIYTAALELFRVPTVGAAVNRKLAIVRDTYAALYEEASSARGNLMELAVVLLIVIEIVIALLQH